MAAEWGWEQVISPREVIVACGYDFGNVIVGNDDVRRGYLYSSRRTA